MKTKNETESQKAVIDSVRIQKRNKSRRKSDISKYDVSMTWCLKDKTFLELGALPVVCTPSEKEEDGVTTQDI